MCAGAQATSYSGIGIGNWDWGIGIGIMGLGLLRGLPTIVAETISFTVFLEP